MAIAYSDGYTDSRALVIGINAYSHVPPLRYARQDAEAVAQLLVSRFGFQPSKVLTLYDSDATMARIRAAYLDYASPSIGYDDRLIIYFAGHGHTVSGLRGEVGYLVPHDGDTTRHASLLRWDDLTRSADLIPAKHILYIMDACYGGLALARATQPGSTRFLRDMHRRCSRQVLTAGKADEVVADAGGPREGHSIFTGHFLDALEGGASSPDGVITASAVMAYVYERVSKDQHSFQTPHYGYLHGDGDFVFVAPFEEPASTGSDRVGSDRLVHIPAGLGTSEAAADAALDDVLKEYLALPEKRIRFDDLCAKELRSALAQLDHPRFSLTSTPVDASTVTERLASYQGAIARLSVIAVLTGRWGGKEHHAAICRMLSQLSDINAERNGIPAWLGLRWFPLTCLLYYTGIAALSSDNYPLLAAMLNAAGADRQNGSEPSLVVTCAVNGEVDSDRSSAYKLLPGHERHYVPRSEYLFTLLQPLLEDQLFIGNAYEGLFDRFEVLYCLRYMLTRSSGAFMWGPLGRFAWKYHRRPDGGPVGRIGAEIRSGGQTWPPIVSGVLPATHQAVIERLDALETGVLPNLTWI